MNGATSVVAVVLALAVTPALAAKKQAPLSPDTATIVCTGPAHTPGYYIQVSRDGEATCLVTGVKHFDPFCVTGRQEVLNAGPYIDELFQDLPRAMPLDRLPVYHAPKGVSSGTSTYVLYLGQRSPDLTAPYNADGWALAYDVIRITRYMIPLCDYKYVKPFHPVDMMAPGIQVP